MELRYRGLQSCRLGRSLEDLVGVSLSLDSGSCNQTFRLGPEAITSVSTLSGGHSFGLCRSQGQNVRLRLESERLGWISKPEFELACRQQCRSQSPVSDLRRLCLRREGLVQSP